MKLLFITLSFLFVVPYSECADYWVKLNYGFTINELSEEYEQFCVQQQLTVKPLEYVGLLSVQSFNTLKDNQLTRIPLRTNNQLSSAVSKENNGLKYLPNETEGYLLSSYRVTLSDNIPSKYLSKFLSDAKSVEYAEECPLLEKHCDLYNDPLGSLQTNQEIYKLCEAANIEGGDPDIIIALSDDGFFSGHSDVSAGIAQNIDDPVDGLDNDNNGYIDDFNGYSFYNDGQGHSSVKNIDNHGSQVGGVIFARPDNSIGMIGTGLSSSFFPIRVSPYQDSAPIIYGYESIIYAAVNGFDVINCSWGSVRNRSIFASKIIELANQNNLTVVNSVGNRNRDRGDNYRLTGQFPSEFPGVIGVGQSNSLDEISNTTNLGASVDVYAPGAGNYTIDNFINDKYAVTANGTSFSAPVVSGIIGLVKSRYPGLNNFQIQEHLRNTSDYITQFDPLYMALKPKRINALKAVSEDPMSSPGLRLLSYYYMDSEANMTLNPDADVKYDLVLIIKNELGDATNISFELNSVYGASFSGENDKLAILQNVSERIDILSGSIGEVSFPVIIENKNFERIVMDLSYQMAGYNSNLLFDLYNSNNIYEFSNEQIGISVAENGILGFSKRMEADQVENTDFFGSGLWLNDIADVLHEGFMFAIEDDRQIVATAQTGYRGTSELKTVKGFEDGKKLILQTDNLPDKMDLQIVSTFNPSSDEEGFIEIKLWAENMYKEQLFNAGLGFYIDIDLARNSRLDSGNNIIEDSRNSLPVELQKAGVAVATVSVPDSAMFFSYGVRSDADNAIAQITGAGLGDINSSVDQDILDAMREGVDLNSVGSPQDISTVFGMRWDGFWDIGEINYCSVCFGGGKTKQESLDKVINCLNQYNTSINDNESSSNNNDIVLNKSEEIQLNGITHYLYDNNGRLILKNDTSISSDILTTGIYYLVSEEWGIETPQKILVIN